VTRPCCLPSANPAHPYAPASGPMVPEVASASAGLAARRGSRSALGSPPVMVAAVAAVAAAIKRSLCSHPLVDQTLGSPVVAQHLLSGRQCVGRRPARVCTEASSRMSVVLLWCMRVSGRSFRPRARQGNVWQRRPPRSHNDASSYVIDCRGLRRQSRARTRAQRHILTRQRWCPGRPRMLPSVATREKPGAFMRLRRVNVHGRQSRTSCHGRLVWPGKRRSSNGSASSSRPSPRGGFWMMGACWLGHGSGCATHVPL
jgi:hypothetical protein